MNQNATISRLIHEAILELESEIIVLFICDHMAAGFSKADQHTITNNETGFHLRVIIGSRNIGVPPFEILPVEKRNSLICESRRGTKQTSKRNRREN